jgi:hypothetical protein
MVHVDPLAGCRPADVTFRPADSSSLWATLQWASPMGTVEQARADRTRDKTGLTTAKREELTRLPKDVRHVGDESLPVGPPPRGACRHPRGSYNGQPPTECEHKTGSGTYRVGLATGRPSSNHDRRSPTGCQAQCDQFRDRVPQFPSSAWCLSVFARSSVCV